MENINTSNIFPSNIKHIKGLRNIIKSSKNIKQENINNYNIKSNINNNIKYKIKNIKNHNINNYKINNKVIKSYNNFIGNTKINNNIKEIIIKTNNSKKIDTTPFQINKQNKKFTTDSLKSNKTQLIESNKNNNSLNYILYTNEEKFNNIESYYRRKTFSHSFKNYSKYIHDDDNNTISRYNKRYSICNNTPKTIRYIRKILQRSNSKTKINMKININNINNTHTNSINSHRIFNRNNIYQLSSNINDNNYSSISNANKGITNVTNVILDNCVQNEPFNYSLDKNYNHNKNHDKYINKDIENELKIKIKDNNEIKENIQLMMREINKIKARQEMIINYNNNKNQINNNNERNIKITNILKKTYNFLNDFNRIINAQNQQINQEIINNLNIFFSN